MKKLHPWRQNITGFKSTATEADKILGGYYREKAIEKHHKRNQYKASRDPVDVYTVCQLSNMTPS